MLSRRRSTEGCLGRDEMCLEAEEGRLKAPERGPGEDWLSRGVGNIWGGEAPEREAPVSSSSSMVASRRLTELREV